MHAVDIRSLSLLQRVLLASDGTVTDIVETAFLEPIRLVNLSQEPSLAKAPDLEIDGDESVMRREVLLQGAESGRNYVYAESFIAMERLPAALREGLLRADTPIGRLWAAQKMETRKELIRIWQEPADSGPAHHFGDAALQGLLARAYRVFSGGRPIMVISEYFPVATTR